MATKLTYAEQLKHPNWQRKRLEVLEAAGFQCSCCGEKEKMLHVHHRRYVKGRMAWDYEGEELQALCEGCHKKHHSLEDLLARILAQADASTGGAYATAAALLGGFFAASLAIDPSLQKEAIEVDGHSHDLGILASLAAGAEWSKLHQAADAVRGRYISPAEEEAYARWNGEQ